MKLQAVFVASKHPQSARVSAVVHSKYVGKSSMVNK